MGGIINMLKNKSSVEGEFLFIEMGKKELRLDIYADNYHKIIGFCTLLPHT